MQDAAVLKLRAKVQLIPDEELERRMPQREGTVDILMDDGRKISEHVAAVRGTFNNPMSREEVIAKARDLMNPVLGAGQTTKLIDAIMALENLKNIRDLRPLLQKG
jgi:2-methylcitrate dehydratase PrpD